MKTTASQFRSVLIQLIFLGSAVCMVCSCSTGSILDRAVQADYDQQLDEAVTLYTKALEEEPLSYDAWNNRGYAYLRLAKFDSAVADFSRAVDIMPEQPTAWYNRAVAWQALGRYDKAADDYSRLLDRSPMDMNLQMMRARAYSAAEDYTAAIGDYDLVLTFDRYFYRAYSERGLALMHQRHYRKALDNCTEAINIAHNLLLDIQEQGFNRYWNPQPPPDSAQETSFRRTVLMTSFDPPQYAKVGKQPPVYGPGYTDSSRYIQALAERRSSLAERGIEAYRSVLSSMYVSRGMVYSDTGLYDKALEDYRTALSWDSTNATAYGNMGWVYYLRQDFQACISYSERALRYDGTALYARYNRALAFLRQGDREQAETAYRDAQEYAGFLLNADNYIGTAPGADQIAAMAVLVRHAQQGAADDLRDLVRQNILTAEAASILREFFAATPP